MRTTLAIEDDVLAAARHLAERQGKTLGEVISALARDGLRGGAQRKAAASRNGVPLLPRATGTGTGAKAAVSVTLALVNQLRDDLP